MLTSRGQGLQLTYETGSRFGESCSTPRYEFRGLRPLATNGQMSEFYYRFVTECSYGCLVFF